MIMMPSDKPLLVMFAHPRCPCTRASLAQLEQLAGLPNNRFKAVVVFYQPKDASRDWSDSGLVKEAKSIRGVEVISDADGELLTRFEVQTSGHTLLYSPQGKLLFSGGITSSRGHIGDNTGFSEVSKILTAHCKAVSCSPIPVFGCELVNRCARNQSPNQN
jgi:hypothetical protein